MRNPYRGLAVVLAAVVVALVGAGTPAHASSSTQVPVPYTYSGAGDPAQSICGINDGYGHVGQRICGFSYSALDWGNGNVETFVIGGDYSIWHAWKGSGGWHPLGGQASSTLSNGVYAYVGEDTEIGIWTFGTDHNTWCRDWPWRSGWWPCSVGVPTVAR